MPGAGAPWARRACIAYATPDARVRALHAIGGSRGRARSSTWKIDCCSRSAVTLNGFDVPTPSADSHVYYVSAAGSDNNTGTSPASPFATIAKARTLLRNGFPDYVLLRRGDTFPTPITGLGRLRALGGRADGHRRLHRPEPPVRRPPADHDRHLDRLCQPGDQSNHPLVSHLYLMGIAFEADARNYRQPPPGRREHQLQVRRGRRHVRGEHPRPDERLPHRGLLVPVLPHRAGPAERQRLGQPDQRPPPPLASPRQLRANFDSGGNSVTSEGIYADGVQGLTLDENVFDHNGWMDPAYSSPRLQRDDLQSRRLPQHQ